jgi:hypothetical protein
MSDLIDAAYWCVLQVSLIVIAGLSLAAIVGRREPTPADASVLTCLFYGSVNGHADSRCTFPYS